MTTNPSSSTTLTFDVAGTRVAIDGLPPAGHRRVADILRPFVVANPGAPHDGSALNGDTPLRLRVTRRGPANWIVEGADADPGVFPSFARLVSHLEWRVISDALAHSATVVPLHAGALAHGNAVVLLVAASESGKTTLTLGLAGRGWEPYGDDITLLDPISLQVHAFPRHFHVMPGSLSLFSPPPTLERDPTLWGYYRPTQWATAARAPTAIFLVERDPARPSALSPVTHAELAAVILRESVRTRLPLSTLANASARLAASVAVRGRLNNGDLTAALDLIEHAALA